MSMHFTVGLRCEGCNAAIVYEDEIPPWRADIPTHAERERAEAWVQENPAPWAFKPRPLYVELYWPDPLRLHAISEHQSARVNWSSVPYAVCPACGGYAYATETRDERQGTANRTAAVPTS